jgi:ribose 5-phosphate isomerase
MTLESPTNWRESAIDRLSKMELEQETKRDKAEEEIEKIVGILEIGMFHTLRYLIKDWEEADEKMALYGERLANL